ncbi:hypothetical protein B7463_g3603, partial [Scytalidium lignicola]
MVLSISPPHWRPLSFKSLQTTSSAHLPPFLIASSFTSTSYTIYLTDLTHLWSESLDQKDIIERSREENTSIDPSDSDDQLEIFLQKIKLGVDGGKDSTLDMEILDGHGKNKAHNGGQSLTLHIKVKLPLPLRSLEWPVNLVLGCRAMFTSVVTYPLARAQQARMKETESLLQRLKEKDQVIQKLVDSIETRGGDLGLLFPHAIGKGERKVSKKTIEDRVKGLGPFDYDSWRKGLDGNEKLSTEKLLDDVFGLEKEPRIEIPEKPDFSEESEEWWENMKGKKIGLSDSGAERSSETNLEIRPALQSSDSTIQDEDAFQVQATPPNLKNSAEKYKTHRNIIDDSTEDEDDGLDLQPRQSAIQDSLPQSPPRKLTPTPPQRSKAKGGTLGGVGTRKAATSARKPPSPAPEHKPMQDESTTEDDEEKEALPPRKSPSPPPKQKTPTPPPLKEKESPAKPKRSTLGKIGVKKKDPTPEPEPEQEQEQPPEAEMEAEPEPPAKSAAPKKKTRLGAIGQSRGGATSSQRIHDDGGNVGDGDQIADDDTRGRRTVSKEKTPDVKEPTPPRETSEERANRKREQLKRELEQKAKAPAKKKRKF